MGCRYAFHMVSFKYKGGFFGLYQPGFTIIGFFIIYVFFLFYQHYLTVMLIEFFFYTLLYRNEVKFSIY